MTKMEAQIPAKGSVNVFKGALRPSRRVLRAPDGRIPVSLTAAVVVYDRDKSFASLAAVRAPSLTPPLSNRHAQVSETESTVLLRVLRDTAKRG